MDINTIPKILPLLPVRDLVVFPLMMVPLRATRRLSVSAVEEAMAEQRLVMVVAQKEAAEEQPGPQALYNMGTICTIMRANDDEAGCQLLLQGLVKARVNNFFLKEEHYLAEVSIEGEVEIPCNDAYQEGLIRTIRSNMADLVNHLGPESKSALMVVNAMSEAGQLADLVAAHLGLTVAQAQSLLETPSGWSRLEQVNKLLSHELAVLAVQDELKKQANADLKASQRQYILEQQLVRIKAELGQEGDDEFGELKERIDTMLLSDVARCEAEKQLAILRRSGDHSAESSVIYNYINTLISFPWYISSRDNLEIGHARQVLDNNHAFLSVAKERILEHLAVGKLNPQNRGAILCFVGPPGVGKTSLGYSIGAALGRKVVRIALGGVSDEAEIRGHRRSYVGAMPGRIIQAIITAGTNNPLIILDEVDKMVAGHNDSPAAALLEVLDPEQNNSFRDHYLGLPVDLSQVFFVATANQLDSLPAALRDRLEVIELSGYTTLEKKQIADRFIIPKSLKECGLTSEQLLFRPAIIERIIVDYTREAGCRDLKRHINRICRKQALLLAENGRVTRIINKKRLLQTYGPPTFRYEEDNCRSLIGLANALAWTPIGGEVLHIEATAMTGNGQLTLTGQLGNIMRESAQIAYSFIKTHAANLGIAPDYFARHDIHLHVPAAAMPKDGPSAGLAMALCLASLASRKPIKAGLAVTGEISLSGQILPVGGLKEKLLAAQRYHIDEVYYPQSNSGEVAEVTLVGGRSIKLLGQVDLLAAINAGLVND